MTRRFFEKKRGFPWIFIFAMLFPFGAMAQEDQGTVYWMLQVESPLKSKIFQKQLAQVLKRTQGHHLLTSGDLHRHIQKYSLKIPDCFEGLEQCEDPVQAWIEALRVDGLVLAELKPGAGRKYQLILHYWRATGGTEKRVTYKGDVLKEVIQTSVSQIFTLASLLSIVTLPKGAKLFVNGRFVGLSPMDVRLGEGKHLIKAEIQDYEVMRTEVELKAGEHKKIDLSLRPKRTQLIVQTSASEVWVYVDGKKIGQANEPLDLVPGKHEIELRASDYEPIKTSVELRAGELRKMQWTLLHKIPDFWTLRERSFRPYQLYVRGGLNRHVQAMDFGALKFPVREGEGYLRIDDNDIQQKYQAWGGHLGFGFVRDFWGLSNEILWGSDALSGMRLWMNRSDQSLETTGGEISRWALRPLWGTWRYLYGPLAVEGEMGFGFSSQSLSLWNDREAVEVASHQFFWGISANLQYHWTDQWYALWAYDLIWEFNDHYGLRHGMRLSIGFYLPWWTRNPHAMHSQRGDQEAPHLLEDSDEE